MQFIKRLFASPPPQKRGLFLYIQPKACQEVIEVRIDTSNEPSLTDDQEGYFVRKLARGKRCPFQVEIEVTFDKNKQVIDKTITNGKEVTEADYLAFVASQTSNDPS